MIWANCDDSYLSLKDYLDVILCKGKVSSPGSDEEYKETQVVVAILYLLWDTALRVADGLQKATQDLVKYMSLFVTPSLISLTLKYRLIYILR